MVDVVEGAANRRGVKRYDCLGRVRLFGEALPPDASGQIFDLSLSGCMLRVDRGLELANDFPVELTIHSRGTSFRVRGSVKRRDGVVQPVGISFEVITSRVQEDLNYLIRELEEKARRVRGNPALAPHRVDRRKNTGTGHQGPERRSPDHPDSD